VSSKPGAGQSVPDKTRLAHSVVAVLKPGRRFVVINCYCRARDETPVLGQPRGPKIKMQMEPLGIRSPQI